MCVPGLSGHTEEREYCGARRAVAPLDLKALEHTSWVRRAKDGCSSDRIWRHSQHWIAVVLHGQLDPVAAVWSASGTSIGPVEAAGLLNLPGESGYVTADYQTSSGLLIWA